MNVGFVGWLTDPLKLNCKFVYAALGTNPAVLKGSHISGGHMPFLVVVAMQNSQSKPQYTRLSNQAIQIAFAQVNQISLQGQAKDTTLWNLL